jgi:hypothetical protein
VPTVLKYGSHNFLETSRPVQACNGIDLPFYCVRLASRILTEEYLNNPFGIISVKYSQWVEYEAKPRPSERGASIIHHFIGVGDI